MTGIRCEAVQANIRVNGRDTDDVVEDEVVVEVMVYQKKNHTFPTRR